MSSSDSFYEYFRLGQDLFKCSLYTDSIAAFTEALNATRDASTQAAILDARALAKTKAFPDDLKEALKDARRIMKLRQHDVRGYLRAGKVLQLMATGESSEQGKEGMLEKAAQIYELGIKVVGEEEGGKGRKILEDMLKKCQVRLNKTVRMDPFASLPNEIVHMIIEYLPFSAVMRMQRVSKGWHTFLRASERRSNHLDFSQGKRPVKKTTLKAYLHHNRMQKYVKKITIKRAAFNDADSLVLMFRAAPLLEEIRLGPLGLPNDAVSKAAEFGKMLKVLELGNMITFSQVERVTRMLPKLEVIVCHNVEPPIVLPVTHEEEKRETVKTMSLSFQSFHESAIEYADFENFLLKFPKLETLELVYPPFNPEHQDLTGLECLKAYSCKGVKGLQFPALPKSIRRLEIANCPYFICSPPSMVPGPADINIAHLEELRLSNCNSSHARTQHVLTRLNFLESPRKLCSLGLNGMPVVMDELIDALIEGGFAENLVDISLGNNLSFNDAVLQKMVHFTKLERIDIGMTTVTGIGIVNLLRKFETEREGKVPWKWVGLNECNKVSNETVEKMRRMGIIVDHKVEF